MTAKRKTITTFKPLYFVFGAKVLVNIQHLFWKYDCSTLKSTCCSSRLLCSCLSTRQITCSAMFKYVLFNIFYAHLSTVIFIMISNDLSSLCFTQPSFWISGVWFYRLWCSKYGGHGIGYSEKSRNSLSKIVIDISSPYVVMHVKK